MFLTSPDLTSLQLTLIAFLHKLVDFFYLTKECFEMNTNFEIHKISSNNTFLVCLPFTPESRNDVIPKLPMLFAKFGKRTFCCHC